MVLTRVGTEMKIYLNGADSGYTGTSYATIAHASDELRIARHLHMEATSPGKYDDVRVYSRALSAADVADLYAATTVIDLTADLVAKYPLDTDATDSVGSNDGTVSGVAFDSLDGKSFATFDGSEDYISIPHNPSNDWSQNQTVSLWMNTTTAARGHMLGKWISTSGTDPSLFNVWVNDSAGVANKATFAFRNSNDVVNTASSTTSVNDGIWHHIVIVLEGSSTMKMYVDGTLEDTTTGFAAGSFTSTRPIYLGVQEQPWLGGVNASTYYDGKLDDVRIFNRALDSDAVAALYAAGAEEAAEAPAPGNTIDVTIDMFDSYGDSWNGGSISVSDSNGVVVYSSTGPANGVKAPAGLSESGSFEPGTYTYTMTPGSYPGEITCTITDEYGTVLANLVGNSGTGTFDLAAPSPVITPTLTTSTGDITIAATLNAEATAAGATGWAYSLSPLGAEGQPHGGTLVALGADVTITPATHEVHTCLLYTSPSPRD